MLGFKTVFGKPLAMNEEDYEKHSVTGYPPEI
jgi:hypothetical protein